MRVCVVGGGAALAQPLLKLWAVPGNTVYALCARTFPKFINDYVQPVRTVNDLLGREYDVLVTLPGTTDDGKLREMNERQWDDVIANTLTAVFSTLSYVKVRDGGNVVVVGSVVGSTGGYGCANYAAAKAGLVGLVRSAALEWAGRGVCVNLLELGVTELGMGARLPDKVKARALAGIPLGRFGTAADFVHAVEFLSTTRWMTGNVLTLAGGVR